jgi:hypothetical protein
MPQIPGKPSTPAAVFVPSGRSRTGATQWHRTWPIPRSRIHSDWLAPGDGALIRRSLKAAEMTCSTNRRGFMHVFRPFCMLSSDVGSCALLAHHERFRLSTTRNREVRNPLRITDDGRIRNSAKRTQRQFVPIVRAQRAIAQFPRNEPNGNRCRYCALANASRDFCETNPTAICTGFAASKCPLALSAKRTQRQSVPVLRPRNRLSHFLPNEPNGNLYRLCGLEIASRTFCETNPTAICTGFAASKSPRAVSAERTQRQPVPVLQPRKAIAQFLRNEPNGNLYRFCGLEIAPAQFLPNEPNGNLYRFCRLKSSARDFYRTNPTAICTGFAASKITHAFLRNEPSYQPDSPQLENAQGLMRE